MGQNWSASITLEARVHIGGHHISGLSHANAILALFPTFIYPLSLPIPPSKVPRDMHSRLRTEEIRAYPRTQIASEIHPLESCQGESHAARVCDVHVIYAHTRDRFA